MTVMQRASWLAAYGKRLGEGLLARLAITEHLHLAQPARSVRAGCGCSMAIASVSASISGVASCSMVRSAP